MKRIFTFFAAMLLILAVSAQTITLTFVGVDGGNQPVQFDHVKVRNLTQGWWEDLQWPDDTMLVMNVTGIKNFSSQSSFALAQNNPNPFEGTTYASLTVAEKGTMAVDITDLTGRLIATQSLTSIQPGNHQLRVTLATPGVYFLTARMNGQTSSVKMVNSGRGNSNSVTFVGSSNPIATTKGNTHTINAGDKMEYIGYTKMKGTEAESETLQENLYASKTVTLHFRGSVGPDSLPCPGTPTVTDIDGNEYNTVTIGYQCWMRENMKTTRFANGDTIFLVDSVSLTQPLRYYPADSMHLVEEYGYLYNWPAVGHGTTGSEENPSGLQGICPDGWHVPSRLEYQQLFNVLHATENFWCDAHNNTYPQNNIAKALADKTGWKEYSSTCSVGCDLSANNATGFSARPAGQIRGNGWKQTRFFEEKALFWDSYAYDDSRAEYVIISYSSQMLSTSTDAYDFAMSVRCVRD